MNLPLQLPLSVQVRDSLSFDNYYAGCNAALIKMLSCKQSSSDKSESFFYIYGREGVGKSHLLLSACNQADTFQQRSIYLPMSELVHNPSRILEGIDSLDLVCIDDIQCIAGLKRWEEAIFNLFNQLRDSQKRLIIAASAAPRQIDIELPDLVSRLSWGIVFSIQALSDEEKVSALQHRAHLRGMDLSEDVARYILHRSSRNMNRLFNVLKRLDGASLRAKRKLSIPFVKEVMNW